MSDPSSALLTAAFVIPGDLALPTGGYAYDRRVLAELARHPDAGVRLRHVALPGGYPTPLAADLAATDVALAAIEPDAILLIDGLAYGAMPAALLERVAQPIVALVHHPLALESGLSPIRQLELRQSERAALKRAHHVVVTSSSTMATLIDEYMVPPDRITVALPGTDPAPRATGTGQPWQLLAVGTIVPRKAYDVLVRALAEPGCRAPDWRLTIVGAARDAGAEQALGLAIAETGLGARITVAGALSDDALAAQYATADLFVMPSLYEGYGMVLAEAMAHGLPIVCTTGGAAALTVPEAAGLKVPPGDAPALGHAIGRMLAEPDLRRRAGDAAWAEGQRLPTWRGTADTIAAVLTEVARR